MPSREEMRSRFEGFSVCGFLRGTLTAFLRAVLTLEGLAMFSQALERDWRFFKGIHFCGLVATGCVHRASSIPGQDPTRVRGCKFARTLLSCSGYSVPFGS